MNDNTSTNVLVIFYFGGNFMGAPSKSKDELKMHATKAELAARDEGEKQVEEMANQYPIPKPNMILCDEEQEIFNEYVKLNPRFTEADSTSLTMLSKYIYKYSVLAFELDVLYATNPLDEQCVSIERRMVAIDKQIVQHITKLRLTLADRLQMANDIAKGMVEEEKLKQLQKENQQPKEVNPLLAVLEATKNAK